MSLELTRWAYQQELPSSQKFLLVTICYQANPTFYGSVSNLAKLTGMNIKTVRAQVHKLVAAGYLTDSGRRRGRTGQIIEYWIVSQDFSEAATEREQLGQFDSGRRPKSVVFTH